MKKPTFPVLISIDPDTNASCECEKVSDLPTGQVKPAAGRRKASFKLCADFNGKRRALIGFKRNAFQGHLCRDFGSSTKKLAAAANNLA